MKSALECRFCYSYKAPGLVKNCCEPIQCSNDNLLSIVNISSVINNNTRTSERSLLLQKQQNFLSGINTVNINSTVQTTINNSSIITSTIYGQLLGVRQQRYEPYQPYVPPVIPSSVMQLQMATANAGTPMSFFTIADCKGNQFVTT